MMCEELVTEERENQRIESREDGPLSMGLHSTGPTGGPALTQSETWVHFLAELENHQEQDSSIANRDSPLCSFPPSAPAAVNSLDVVSPLPQMLAEATMLKEIVNFDLEDRGGHADDSYATDGESCSDNGRGTNRCNADD